MNTSETLPTRNLLCAILKLAANDVRSVTPSACPKNERAEAKRTAEEFFNTKFYREACDALNLPACKMRSAVFAEKNKYEELDSILD